MLNSFAYRSYSRRLQEFKQTHVDLCFSDFCQEPSAENYFILRHDVDLSPNAALKMATLEAEMGIRASYFLLFTSPTYNLLSEQHRDFPRRLTDLGHEVGLHYDVRAYAQLSEPSLLGSLLMEAELLGKLSGTEVQSIAMHNPSTCGEDPFRNVEGFINAYADQFTKKMPYLSDSGGAWRDSTILALQGNIPPRFQLLIHPIFWGEDNADRWARLEDFTNLKVHEITVVTESIRTLWLQHAGVLEHDRRNTISS